MKNIISKVYVVLALLYTTAVTFAQSSPGSTSNDEEPGGMEGADDQLPISDYLWVLLIVGLVFVFLKFRSIQKNSTQG